MTTTMAIQDLPRSTLRLGVTATRLPLTAAEALLGHRGDAEWPPALAFDAAQAHLKLAVGGVVRDDVLQEEGRLIAAKVDKLRQAARLEAAAELRTAAADDQLAEARSSADRRASQARSTARRRKQQADRARNDAERKAAASAARKERLVSDATDAAATAVDRAARGRRRTALAKEQAALDKEKAATARTNQAAASDARIAASKRARSTKR
ncbi:MAG: hypothetical protein JWM89_336 [Acidimicrobiales bacterium]|nr:hypothetical protein [Acidimicrobiales bacterium]